MPWVNILWVYLNITNICDRIWEEGPLCAKHCFLGHFWNCYRSRALGFPLGLLLHRSKVRSYSKPPVLSSEMPKLSIKTMIFGHDWHIHSPAHAGNGQGLEFLVSVAGWWKNIHTKVQVHSCYGSRVNKHFFNESSGIAWSGPFSQILSYLNGTTLYHFSVPSRIYYLYLLFLECKLHLHAHALALATCTLATPYNVWCSVRSLSLNTYFKQYFYYSATGS